MKIDERLRVLSQGENFVEFQKRIIKTNLEIVGVKTGDVKCLARQLLREGGEMNFPNSYEGVLLEGLVKASSSDLGWLNQFLPKVDNWAIVDSVCAAIKRKDDAAFDFFAELCQDPREFFARFGIVAMRKFVTAGDNKRILKAFEGVICDKYYAQMGIAWVLSDILIANAQNAPKIMQKIIKNPHFNIETLNKAIQKAIDSYRLSQETKSKLKEMKQ